MRAEGMGDVTRGRRETPAGESLVVSGPAGAVEFSLAGFDWHYRRPPYEGAEAGPCYLGGTCYAEGGASGKWLGAGEEDVLAELDRRYAEMAGEAAEDEEAALAGEDDGIAQAFACPRHPGEDYPCPECAVGDDSAFGRDAAASDMADICGLRIWGDPGEVCTRPSGHEPVPSCSGKPRPFSRAAREEDDSDD